MAVYSIKELEKLSGIKAHTIRTWEKRYNLIKPHRTNTNIRYYTDCDLKKILNVTLLNRNGVKISNIAKLNDLELKEEIMRISDLGPSQKNIIDSMIIAMIDLDEFKFTGIINKYASKNGFRNCVINVIYPFLNKIGILWQAGDVSPFQEHFVSNLIRQKIIAATDSISTIFNPKCSMFLLFLPEGEWHEIGLLFASYLLKEAGHEVVYLGQSVAYSDILAAGTSKNFDHLLVSSISTQPEFDFIIYLKDLSGAFPDKKIICISHFNGPKPSELSDNHIQIDSFNDFLDYLKKIAI